MLPGVDLADIHGQHAFNFQHAAISAKDSKHWLDFAFRRDFERNGPSIYRICRTTLDGWRRYGNDADARVRARFAREARALERWLRRRPLGHGAPPAQRIPRSRSRSAPCARKSAASSAWSAALVTAVLGPVPPLDHAPRRAPPRRRHRPTSPHHHRAPQLDRCRKRWTRRSRSPRTGAQGD